MLIADRSLEAAVLFRLIIRAVGFPPEAGVEPLDGGDDDLGCRIDGPVREVLDGVKLRKLAAVAGDDELLDIAKALEEAALTDEFFIERRLYPNVDFYTGVIYRAMGFPTRMFTVLFALGRLPGWIAHWRELHTEPNKIGRPRQIYTGYGERDYLALDGR